MIAMQYDKNVEVDRMTADDSGIGEQFELHIASVKCHIQPLDESFSEDLSGSFGKNFLMFADVCDILEGDRIIESGTVYRVIGVDSYNFLKQNRHMEITIRKFI